MHGEVGLLLILLGFILLAAVVLERDGAQLGSQHSRTTCGRWDWFTLSHLHHIALPYLEPTVAEDSDDTK